MTDSEAKADPDSPKTTPAQVAPASRTAEELPAASPVKAAARAAKAPKVTAGPSAGLREMLDHAQNQRQAEVLATRLAVLKQQETRVTGQIEETRVRTQDLVVRKAEQAKRIRDKAEALRKMHEQDGFYQEHHHPEHDKGRQASTLPNLPNIGEGEPLVPSSHHSAIQELHQAQTPRLGLSATSLKSGQTPRKLSSQAPQPASGQKTPRSGRSSFVAPKSAELTPRVQSSRIQTSDIVQLAHAQLASKWQQENNQRDPAMLGQYGGQGERIWMHPRQQTDAKDRLKDATIPAQIAKYSPKDLVAQMAKKEVELKARLEAARRTQLAADDALEARFKVYSAQQVSARKAIRDGNY